MKASMFIRPQYHSNSNFLVIWRFEKDTERQFVQFMMIRAEKLIQRWCITPQIIDFDFKYKQNQLLVLRTVLYKTSNSFI